MPLAELAKAAKSWNLREAGFGMAAVNAYYNTPKRLEALGAYEPFENYCTDGVDLQGKHIGVVGHLNMPESVYQQASSVRILERSPRTGDYPDSACDWLAAPPMRCSDHNRQHPGEQDPPSPAGAVSKRLYHSGRSQLSHVSCAA